ncbi:hypothetical protein D9757_001974 [Collybiopsis confluens]|uniref:Uncharacterized protein n=1 Tax=Collybiopsis confluens TaxID=2823264 RepID=A0A8H5HXR2_9AGAR|nr:hypothetical protein D9757_001974 [Collybiopsis confluens]
MRQLRLFTSAHENPGAKMATGGVPQIRSELGSTFGALEISTILSSILFGVVTTQTYAYHRRYPRDSFWTKIIVDALWLVELGHTICTIHFLYYWSVLWYGHPNALESAPVTLALGVVFYGICVALGKIVQFRASFDLQSAVQGYFTFRLWRFTARSSISYRLIPLIMVALISARFGVIISGAVEAFRMPYYQPFVVKWRTLIIASQIIGAITDLSIMLTLVINLRQRRVDAYESVFQHAAGKGDVTGATERNPRARHRSHGGMSMHTPLDFHDPNKENDDDIHPHYLAPARHHRFLRSLT